MLSLVHLVTAESKQVPKTKRWGDAQGHSKQSERAPSGRGWKNLSDEQVNEYWIIIQSVKSVYMDPY